MIMSSFPVGIKGIGWWWRFPELKPFVSFLFSQPDREDEKQRIESVGGRVIYWNGYRVLGVLAMSRAIGKLYPDNWSTYKQ